MSRPAADMSSHSRPAKPLPRRRRNSRARCSLSCAGVCPRQQAGRRLALRRARPRAPPCVELPDESYDREVEGFDPASTSAMADRRRFRGDRSAGGALGRAAAAQAKKAPADFYGVAPQTGLSAPTSQRMGTAKVGVMRIIINWAAIDQTSADGDNDWSGIDAHHARCRQERRSSYSRSSSARRRGSPRASTTTTAPATAARRSPPKSPAALAAWQKFVGEAVARYGPGGDFWTLHPEVAPDPITDWQALERDELEDVLRAEAEGEVLREAAEGVLGRASRPRTRTPT